MYVHTPTGIHCTYPYQNVPTYIIIKIMTMMMMIMITGHVVLFPSMHTVKQKPEIKNLRLGQTEDNCLLFSE